MLVYLLQPRHLECVARDPVQATGLSYAAGTGAVDIVRDVVLGVTDIDGADGAK